MNLRTWIDVPGNSKKYREWLNDPVTQAILAGMEDECEPIGMPTDTTNSEMALYLYGIMVGSHRVLSRLKTIDELPKIAKDLTANYQAKRYMMEVHGYDEKSATEAIARIRGNK